MNKELKPCPFCGGKADIIDETNYYSHIFYWVECLECDCRTSDYEDNLGKAIEAWNRRVANER